MDYILKNNEILTILEPLEKANEILKLMKVLSIESDNFPFTSEDVALDANQINNFINYLSKMENSIFVVGIIQGKIIALGYLEGGRRSRTFHSCNLGIGVLQNYQELGIGNEIMNYLLKFASEGEYIAKINLQVRVDNKKAIAMYKKHGFILEGKESRAMFIDGNFYDYLNMGYLVN